MANNRELTQLAAFVVVNDATKQIGIATTATPYVGIGTTSPQAKLQVVGDTILGQVRVTSSGIVTSSNPGITTIKYYGDGSNLTGVTAFYVDNQSITINPVYPTFASNTGVSTVGIATTGLVFEPSTNFLGVNTSNPQYTIDVVGDINITGDYKINGDSIVDDITFLALALG